MRTRDDSIPGPTAVPPRHHNIKTIIYPSRLTPGPRVNSDVWACEPKRSTAKVHGYFTSARPCHGYPAKRSGYTTNASRLRSAVRTNTYDANRTAPKCVSEINVRNAVREFV